MSPDTYLSKELKNGESVVLVTNRSRWLMIPGLAGGALFGLAAFFLLAWFFRHGWYGVLGFFILLGLAVLILLRAWILWQRNVLIITNQRIVHFDQRGFFEQHVAEAGYEKIQDVRYAIRGLWATLLSFGTVTVQTAGSTNDLSLSGIRHPVKVQRVITEQQSFVAAPPARPINNVVDVRPIRRS